MTPPPDSDRMRRMKAIGPLMQRVHDGDNDAALELVTLFSPAVLRSVRRRLDRQLRLRVDSDDMMQEVWAAFFARPEYLRRFHRAKSLMGFLISLAVQKVEEERRYQLRSKRTLLREGPLPEAGSDAAEGLLVDARTPGRIAMAREALHDLFWGKPPRHQEVLCRRATGEAIVDIATAVGLHERTVYKILEQASAWPVEC